MHRLARFLLACVALAAAMAAPARAGAQVRYASEARFESFVAGLRFTCALAEHGQAYCWGQADRGQVGAGTIDMQCTRSEYASGPCARGPVKVRGPHRFVALGAGDEHACGIDGSSEIWCWGKGDFRRDREGRPEWCPVEMDDGVTLPLACSREPVRIPRGERKGAVAVDGGDDRTCAVDLAGAAWCWSTRFPERQQRIALDRPATTIAAGGSMACVLTDERGVRCWNDLQHGGAVTTPTPDTGFVALDVGTAHACALDRQGVATCWGSDEDAALGVGPTLRVEDALPPAKVLGDHRFAHVVTGPTRSCGIDREGALWCWGRVREATPRADDECLDSNWLSGGDNACTSQPVRVHPGLHFTALAIGGAHQCGLTKEMGSVCWGAGEAGQLGNGSLNASETAIAIRTDGVPADLAAMLDFKDRFATVVDHGGLGLVLLALLALTFRRRAGWSLAHYTATWAVALALYTLSLVAGSTLDGAGAALAGELQPQLLVIVVVLTAYVLARAFARWWRVPAELASAGGGAGWTGAHADDGHGRNRGLALVLGGWTLVAFGVLGVAGRSGNGEVDGWLAVFAFMITAGIALVLSIAGGAFALARLRWHRDDGRAWLALTMALVTVTVAASVLVWGWVID